MLRMPRTNPRPRVNPADVMAQKLINTLNRNVDTDADIKHDPLTAIRTIFVLGLTIGKMDERAEANTVQDMREALVAVDRIAAHYQHLVRQS